MFIHFFTFKSINFSLKKGNTTHKDKNTLYKVLLIVKFVKINYEKIINTTLVMRGEKINEANKKRWKNTRI